MRLLGLISLVFSFALAHAEECGLYQVEDYGDRVSYTLTDFNTQRPMVLNLRITNSESPVVGTMVNGLCYCVNGKLSPDPAYNNDPLYKLLEVTRVTRGPWQSCSPTK